MNIGRLFIFTLYRVSIFLILFGIWGPFSFLFSQTFEEITDPNNPIVTTQTDGNYSGAAWIDFDNDGDMDLFTTKTYLFRNDGNGDFTLLNTNLGQFINHQTFGNGTSWGDYDNDGDIDCLISGYKSIIYRNDGNENFTPVTDGVLGLSKDTRAWACAWADYNNDGFLDAIITHPKGFIGVPYLPNQLFLSNGDGRFTKITDYEFTQDFSTYTVATWNDYDLDGDEDLFIASGPAGSGAVDYLYKNMLTETGSVDFQRIDTSPIATDLQDGQVWNWIDYDNDGDLDGFVSNYSGERDRFYVNEDGNYTSVTNALTSNGSHLANAWGDLDNDGFLDVIVTSEGGTRYYRNLGDGSFQQETIAITSIGQTRSVTIGDYDNDGKLDVFVSGQGDGRGLFHNLTQNGKHWILINLKGTVSNYSAIGAKIRVKASINDTAMWQFREVSAQNSFDGHNSLRVHFGLGNASTIDSLIIKWPQGGTKILTNVNSNQILNITEDIPQGFLRTNFTVDSINGEVPLTVHFKDLSITDPDSLITSWSWDFDDDGIVDDTTQNPTWTFNQTGTYSVKLSISTNNKSLSLIREDYITVDPITNIDNENNSKIVTFNLKQNYPNPFNPSTTIAYSLPDESNVTLIIYNALGQEISTLVKQNQSKGNYSVKFNSNSLFGGNGLTSGIYIYQLKAAYGNKVYTSTKKMILLK